MKKQNGITMISLVIGIIILLILAGAVIKLIVEDNSVLKKAQNSVVVNRKGTAIEQVSMAWNSAPKSYFVNENGKNQSPYFIANKLTQTLSVGEIIQVSYKINEAGDSELIYKITEKETISYYKMLVTAIGDVNIIGEETETVPTLSEPLISTKGTLLSKVKENPAEYYGKKVSGYTSQNGISDWRIFYADSTNVYLISTDYILSTLAKVCNDSMSYYEGDVYTMHWDYIPEVASVENANKFNPVVEGETMAWTGDYGIYDNGKCVSTLLDTNRWTSFLDKADGTGKGEMAIGSPTLNMFVASWNTKYPTQKLYCNNSAADGQYFGNTTNPTTYRYDNENSMGYKVEEKENMYYPHKIGFDGSYGYWLATLGTADLNTGDMIMHVYYDGVISGAHYVSSYLSLRPVVSLKTDVTTLSTEDDDIIILD